MGGDESKSAIQDNYFLLEHISKMSLTSSRVISYYLIASQQGPTSKLRQYFKVDTFPSVATLKQEMLFVNRNEIVKVIVTDCVKEQDLEYLQAEPKVAQIIAYNSNVQGGKIAGKASQPEELIALLNSLEAKDPLEMDASNVLFTNEQDTKSLNKYRLSYHCNTNYSDRKAAKADFLALARKLYPAQKDEIDRFEKEYDLSLKGVERRNMVKDWVFKEGFYFDMVQHICRHTTDPKRIAYLRLAIKDIYETIAEEYRANKLHDEFIVVVDLTQQQKQKLQKAEMNFMLFTTFVKGFPKHCEKQASAEWKKRPGSVLMHVNIYRADREDKLDFGFICHNNQILVNIYNIFRVDQEFKIKNKNEKAEILYGILPIADQHRRNEEDRPHMHPRELDLTRNYDFLEDLMSKVDGQATLLQLSGYYKDSLQIYDRKIDVIRKSNSSQNVMNRCLIKKGDALALSGDFEAAEKTYRYVDTNDLTIKVIALIHLADLYMRLNEEEKLYSTIDMLQPLLSVLQKEKGEKEEYYRGQHFMAIKSMKKGSFKKAETMLVSLIKSISAFYKPQEEGKPLYHDVLRSLSACQFKLGRPGQALASLNLTLSWQLVCQGKTHNVAMTETLIQSVSRTCGNQAELTRSLERMQGLKAEIDSNQTRLTPATITNINSSMIAISM